MFILLRQSSIHFLLNYITGENIIDNGRLSYFFKLKYYTKFRITIFFIIFLLIGTYFITLSSSQLVNQNPLPMNFAEGQILYTPMFATTTYLRYADGSLNHSWAS